MSGDRWWQNALDTFSEVAEKGASLIDVADVVGSVLNFAQDSGKILFTEQGENAQTIPGTESLKWGIQKVMPLLDTVWGKGPLSDDIEVAELTFRDSFRRNIAEPIANSDGVKTYVDSAGIPLSPAWWQVNVLYPSYQALKDTPLNEGAGNTFDLAMDLFGDGLMPGVEQPETIGELASTAFDNWHKTFDDFQNVTQTVIIVDQMEQLSFNNPDHIAAKMTAVERIKYAYAHAQTTSIGANIALSMYDVDITDLTAVSQFIIDHPEKYHIASASFDIMAQVFLDPLERGAYLISGRTFKTAKHWLKSNYINDDLIQNRIKAEGRDVVDADSWVKDLDKHFKPGNPGDLLVNKILETTDAIDLSPSAKLNNIYDYDDNYNFNEALGKFINDTRSLHPIDKAEYGPELAAASAAQLASLFTQAAKGGKPAAIASLKLQMGDYRTLAIIEGAALEQARIMNILTRKDVPDIYKDDLEFDDPSLRGTQTGLDNIRTVISTNVERLSKVNDEIAAATINKEEFLDYLAKNNMDKKNASKTAKAQYETNEANYNFAKEELKNIQGAISSAVEELSNVLNGNVDLLDAERIFTQALKKSEEIYGKNVVNFVENQISWSLPVDPASTLGAIDLANAKDLPFHDAYDMVYKKAAFMIRSPETLSPGVNDAGLWIQDEVPIDSVVTRTALNNEYVPEQRVNADNTGVSAMPVVKDPRTIDPNDWESFQGDKPYNQFAYRYNAVNSYLTMKYPGLIGHFADEFVTAYGIEGLFGSLLGPAMLKGVDQKISLPSLGVANKFLDTRTKGSMPNDAPGASRNIAAEFMFTQTAGKIILWKGNIAEIDETFNGMLLAAEILTNKVSGGKSISILEAANINRNALFGRFVKAPVAEKQKLYEETITKLFKGLDTIFDDIWPISSEIKLSEQLFLSHKQDEFLLQTADQGNRAKVYGNDDISFQTITEHPDTLEPYISMEGYRSFTDTPITPSQFNTASVVPDFDYANKAIRKLINAQNSSQIEVDAAARIAALNDTITMFWKRGKLFRFPGYPLLTNIDDAFRSLTQMNALELGSGYLKGLADIRTTALYQDIRRAGNNPTGDWLIKTRKELQTAFNELGEQQTNDILNGLNVVVRDFSTETGTVKLNADSAALPLDKNRNVIVESSVVETLVIPGNVPGLPLTPDQALNLHSLPENSVSFGEVPLDHEKLLVVYDRFEQLGHVRSQQKIWEEVYTDAGFGYGKGSNKVIGNQTKRAIVGVFVGSYLGGIPGFVASTGAVSSQQSIKRVAQREIALQGLNLQITATHLLKEHTNAKRKQLADSMGINSPNIFDDSIDVYNASGNPVGGYSLQLQPPWQLPENVRYDPQQLPKIEGALEAADGQTLQVSELRRSKYFTKLDSDEMIPQGYQSDESGILVTNQQRGAYDFPKDGEVVELVNVDTGEVTVPRMTTTVIDEIAFAVMGRMNIHGATLYLRQLFNPDKRIAKLGALQMLTAHYAVVGLDELISTRIFANQQDFLSTWFKYQNQTNTLEVENVPNNASDLKSFNDYKAAIDAGKVASPELVSTDTAFENYSTISGQDLTKFLERNQLIWEQIAKRTGFGTGGNPSLLLDEDLIAQNITTYNPSVKTYMGGLDVDGKAVPYDEFTQAHDTIYDIVNIETGVNIFDLIYTKEQQAIYGLYHFAGVSGSGWKREISDGRSSISNLGNTLDGNAQEVVDGLKSYALKRNIPEDDIFPKFISDTELDLLQKELTNYTNRYLSQLDPGSETINVYRSGSLSPQDSLNGPISFTLNPDWKASNYLPWFEPETSRALASSSKIKEDLSFIEQGQTRIDLLKEKHYNSVTQTWDTWESKKQYDKALDQQLTYDLNYEASKKKYGIRMTQVNDVEFEFQIYNKIEDIERIHSMEPMEASLLMDINVKNITKKQNLESSENVFQTLIKRISKKKNASEDIIAELQSEALWDPKGKTYKPTALEAEDVSWYSYTYNDASMGPIELSADDIMSGLLQVDRRQAKIQNRRILIAAANDLNNFLVNKAKEVLAPGSNNWNTKRLMNRKVSRSGVLGVSADEEISILRAISQGDASYFTLNTSDELVSKYKVNRDDISFAMDARLKTNNEDEVIINPSRVTKEYDMLTEVNSPQVQIAELQQLERAIAIAIGGDEAAASKFAFGMARARDSYPSLYEPAALAGRKQLAAGLEPTVIGNNLLVGELTASPQEYAFGQKSKEQAAWGTELWGAKTPNNSQLAGKIMQYDFDSPVASVAKGFPTAWNNQVNKFYVPLPDGPGANAFRTLPKLVWARESVPNIVAYLRSPEASDFLAVAPEEWVDNLTAVVERMTREFDSVIPPITEFANVRQRAAKGIEVTWEADIQPILDTMPPTNSQQGLTSPIYNIRGNLGYSDFGKITGSDIFTELTSAISVKQWTLKTLSSAFERGLIAPQNAARSSIHTNYVNEYKRNFLARIAPLLNETNTRFVSTFQNANAEWVEKGYGFELLELSQGRLSPEIPYVSDNFINPKSPEFEIAQPIATEEILRLRHNRITKLLDDDLNNQTIIKETIDSLQGLYENNAGNAIAFFDGKKLTTNVVDLLFPEFDDMVKDIKISSKVDSRGTNLEQWIVEDLAFPNRQKQIYTSFLMAASKPHKRSQAAVAANMYGGDFYINDEITNLFVDRPTLEALQNISRTIEKITETRSQIQKLTFITPEVDVPQRNYSLDFNGRITDDSEGINIYESDGRENISAESLKFTQDLNDTLLLRSNRITGEQLNAINTKAQEYADEQVKQTLFNLASRTKFQELFKTMAPFLGAGQEVLSAWTRHAYHNGARVQKYARALTAQTDCEDEEGNECNTVQVPTDFFGVDLTQDGLLGFGKFSAISGKKLKINASAALPINSLVSFPLGGYYTSVIANEVLLENPSLGRVLGIWASYGLDPEGNTLTRTMKNLLPNWAIIQSGRPFQIPGTDKILKLDTDKFNRTKSWAFDSLVIRHYQLGNEAMTDVTKNMIDDMSFDMATDIIELQALFASAMPFPLQIQSEFSDVATKYWETYLQYDEATANEEIFNTEFFIMKARRTQIIGAASGTLKGSQLHSKHKEMVNLYPEIKSWIITSYGPLGQEIEYNRMVVDSEISQGLRETIPDTERLFIAEAAEGWYNYNTAVTAVDQQWRLTREAYAAQNFNRDDYEPMNPSKNTEAFDDSTAGAMWAKELVELKKNPSWLSEYNSLGDPNSFIRIIHGFREVANDPDFAGRLDMPSLVEYMNKRDEIMEVMKDMNAKWSDDSSFMKTIRLNWQNFRNEISSFENPNWIDFAPLFNRFLIDDVDLENFDTHAGATIPRLRESN